MDCLIPIMPKIKLMIEPIKKAPTPKEIKATNPPMKFSGAIELRRSPLATEK